MFPFMLSSSARRAREAATDAPRLAPTRGGIMDALWHGVPAVAMISVAEPKQGRVVIRIRLRLWTWATLGWMHGYVRGRAEKILKDHLAGGVELDLRVT